MTTFDFYVYNRHTDRKYSLCLKFDTDDIEVAKKMFKDVSLYYYCEVLDVEVNTPKETPFYEGDFSSSKSFKRTILV